MLAETPVWPPKDTNKPRGRAAGASTMSFAAPNQCCRAIAYTPDGTGLACGCNDGAVIFCDARGEAPTLTTLFTVHDATRWIQTLKFDPSGGAFEGRFSRAMFGWVGSGSQRLG